jgi:hypothetical protein
LITAENLVGKRKYPRRNFIMINVKKLLTRAVATLTCAAMLAGNGLMAYASDNVTINPADADYSKEGECYYVETDGYYAYWDDDELIINVYEDSHGNMLNIDKNSIITVGGKTFKLEAFEKDPEVNVIYYFFEIVDEEGESSSGDPYLDNLAKKIKEIYAAQNKQSLKGNNHVEYKEGDGIRYDMMEALKNTTGVVLDFYFTYKGKRYHAIITSEDAKNAYQKDIEVYGPEYIIKNFNCKEISYGTE